MLSFRTGTAGLVILGLSAGSAMAADIYEPAPEPEMTPVERVEQGWRFAVTPRFWYFLENDVYFQNENPTFQQSNETIGVPFAGGSISVTPPGLGGTTFSLTGFYGEGSGEVLGAGPFFNILSVGRIYEASVDETRLDIEGIAQIPVAEGLSGIVGGRFIRFTRDEAGSFTTFLVPPVPPVVTPATFDLEQRFYLAELGFGVTRPATESVLFFGNLTGMIGYADVVETSGDFGVFNVPTDNLEGGVAGVDTNAGVGFRLSDNLLLSGRYRLFYLSNPDFEFTEGGTFIHGPEANLTISFGG